jgi:hypothetical protein
METGVLYSFKRAIKLVWHLYVIQLADSWWEGRVSSLSKSKDDNQEITAGLFVAVWKRCFSVLLDDDARASRTLVRSVLWVETSQSLFLKNKSKTWAQTWKPDAVPHSQGHWIFILAMHPEGKWTTNPNVTKLAA